MNKYPEAANFIKDHYERDDKLCFVAINRSVGKVQQEFKTAEDAVSDSYQARLRALNANGHDVYVGVNTYKPEATQRTKADVAEVRHVHLDMDEGGKAAVQRVVNDPKIPTPHAVVETSPDKHQLWWKVEGFDQESAENLVRGMVREYGADPAAVDTARVFRVPGLRNTKYEKPHYARVKDYGQTPSKDVYRPEDFPKYDRAQEAPAFGHKAQQTKSSLKDSPSERDWGVVCRKLEQGVPKDQVIRELAQLRREEGNKQYPEAYAERTVERAAQKVIMSKAQAVSRPLPSEAYRARETDRGR